MIKKNISLKNLTNYKIGGKAKYFCEVNSTEEIKECLDELKKINDSGRIFVLGGGTNLLVSDEGFDGLVIHNNINFISKVADNAYEIGAGTTVSDLIKYSLENSLAGFSWAGGLPGTVGGAVFGNAGAFGSETKDSVLQVKSFSLEDQAEKLRHNVECQFDYRQSVFKKELANKEIITSVILELINGDYEKIKEEIDSHIEYRKSRQPLELPSAGSTFKNIPLDSVPAVWQEKFKEKIKNDPFPVIPAAVFISEAGLMGKQVGKAQVSTKHPNFLVNLGDARSADVLMLIDKVKEEVRQKFGVELEPEVIKV